MRRAYNSVLTLPQLSTCPQCAAPYVPHRVCPACGFYKGRQVITVEALRRSHSFHGVAGFFCFWRRAGRLPTSVCGLELVVDWSIRALAFAIHYAPFIHAHRRRCHGRRPRPRSGRGRGASGLTGHSGISELYFVGNETDIAAASQKCGLNDRRVHIVHACQVLTMEDKPVDGLRKKKDCSLMRAVELVKDGRGQALISTGNTGGIVAASTIRLRTLEGVERPAIAPVIPRATAILFCSMQARRPNVNRFISPSSRSWGACTAAVPGNEKPARRHSEQWFRRRSRGRN